MSRFNLLDRFVKQMASNAKDGGDVSDSTTFQTDLPSIKPNGSPT